MAIDPMLKEDAKFFLQQIDENENARLIRHLSNWNPVSVSIHPGFCCLIRFFSLALQFSSKTVQLFWCNRIVLHLTNTELSFSERYKFKKYRNIGFGWRLKVRS